MGKTLQGGERDIILRVIEFFENEKRNRKYVIPVDQALKRACLATGCSKRTLLRIKKEAAELRKQQELNQSGGNPEGDSPIQRASSTIKLSTPGKKRKPSSKKITLDHFELCALKGIVRRFHVHAEVPTINKVLAAAKKELNFQGGRDTLRRVMREQLGYKFKKIDQKDPLSHPVLLLKQEPAESVIDIKCDVE